MVWNSLVFCRQRECTERFKLGSHIIRGGRNFSKLIPHVLQGIEGPNLPSMAESLRISNTFLLPKSPTPILYSFFL